MQAHWSSIFVLPKQILKAVDDTIRQFVWSGTDMKKTGEKVAWVEVCCPKKEWGLGIRSMVDWNKAAMIGHLWILLEKRILYW